MFVFNVRYIVNYTDRLVSWLHKTKTHCNVIQIKIKREIY